MLTHHYYFAGGGYVWFLIRPSMMTAAQFWLLLDSDCCSVMMFAWFNSWFDSHNFWDMTSARLSLLIDSKYCLFLFLLYSFIYDIFGINCPFNCPSVISVNRLWSFLDWYCCLFRLLLNIYQPYTNLNRLCFYLNFNNCIYCSCCLNTIHSC